MLYGFSPANPSSSTYKPGQQTDYRVIYNVAPVLYYADGACTTAPFALPPSNVQPKNAVYWSPLSVNLYEPSTTANVSVQVLSWSNGNGCDTTPQGTMTLVPLTVIYQMDVVDSLPWSITMG